MKVKEIKKGDKILHSHLGTQPPVSGVVMESPVQGRGVRSTILVDVKGPRLDSSTKLDRSIPARF